MKQINTNRYGDYGITDHIFSVEFPFKRGIDMRLICDHIFQRQHHQIIKLVITLCKHSIDRYNLNIMRIIGIIYHIHIGFELYNLAYINKLCWVYEEVF